MCVADGDDVVAKLKAASMLGISISASAIVVSSERVELHFMLSMAWHDGSSIRQWPRRTGFNPSLSHTKD